MENTQNLTKKDFVVDGPVKWCAGCGGFSILSAVQNALPETGVDIDDIVFVSGIGCSSRFPYYIETYGFHGLHGRASALASGMKAANPKLSLWQITGDGDAMAIGGNHFIHQIRRNIDINVLIFNNRIYGLTKGQYSPTTPKGAITKTSPHGTIENPFNPGELTIGAQGTFFARVIDKEPKVMKEVFIEAHKHKGTSIVEVLQNCVIFNNAVHEQITGKDVKDDRTIYLKHGEPMIFGKERDKGLVLDGGFNLKVVKIGEDGITEDDILIHNAKDPNPNIHYMLGRMSYPDFPVAVGVIRSIKSSTYDELLEAQVDHAMEESKYNSIDDLLNSGNIHVID